MGTRLTGVGLGAFDTPRGPGRLTGQTILLGGRLHRLGSPETRHFRWTYVAGTRSCIDAVLADEGLEALEAHPDQRGDYLSDSINGPVEPG